MIITPVKKPTKTYLPHPPLPGRRHSLYKRALDLFISSFLIVFLLSWLLPVLGILIVLDSQGPVFFIQQRRKRNFGCFPCIKLRSMVVNEEADTKMAAEDDPRITRVGRWLRRTHLDEIPQLFNVWWGDMSLVGPRPYMLVEDSWYSQHIDGYGRRGLMKPGITGLAQSKGYFGFSGDKGDMEKKLTLDISYVQDWSLHLDLRILLNTLRFIWPR